MKIFISLFSARAPRAVSQVFRQFSKMSESKVPLVLVSCGSFNPVTNMHLRMFELAKDKFESMGKYNVVSGIMSPVSNGYKKKGLIDAEHRIKMIELALRSNDWVNLNTWEAKQENWLPTLEVLEHYKQESIEKYGPQVKLIFLCGADLVNSFIIPNVWTDEHIIKILTEYGLACVHRMGTNPEKIIYENDLLYDNKENIYMITDWIINDISSTKIRRAVSRNESIKYVTHDDVVRYIKENNLYRKN